MSLLILNGPETWELVVALFDRHPALVDQRHVEFSVKHELEKSARIRLLKLTGLALGYKLTPSWIFECRDDKSIAYRGDYDPLTRKGTLEFSTGTADDPRCPRCNNRARLVGGHFKSELVYQCTVSCRTSCDYDNECFQPFEFTLTDRECRFTGRTIAVCSPHNHS